MVAPADGRSSPASSQSCVALPATSSIRGLSNRRTARSRSEWRHPRGCAFLSPRGADPVHVAGGLNPGLGRGYRSIARAAEIGALGTVLILGVTGMVGSLAVQHARMLGATHVVGVGQNPAGLERASKLGAETVALT